MPRLVVITIEPLVALGDDLEQCGGCFAGEGQVANFIELCRHRDSSMTSASSPLLPRPPKRATPPTRNARSPCPAISTPPKRTAPGRVEVERSTLEELKHRDRLHRHGHRREPEVSIDANRSVLAGLPRAGGAVVEDAVTEGRHHHYVRNGTARHRMSSRQHGVECRLRPHQLLSRSSHAGGSCTPAQNATVLPSQMRITSMAVPDALRPLHRRCAGATTAVTAAGCVKLRRERRP